MRLGSTEIQGDLTVEGSVDVSSGGIHLTEFLPIGWGKDGVGVAPDAIENIRYDLIRINRTGSQTK